MKLLICYNANKKVVDVTDKSEIKAAVKKIFEKEIRNRPIIIQYYAKDFNEYIDLEDADVEDHGKMKLIVQDCMDTGSATLAVGEHVKQKFIGSSVNVVGGDQHVTHVTYANTEPEINEEQLIKVVNDNTKDMTRDRILKDFENEKLLEPGFEVYPQMLEVNIDAYYKGHHGLELTENNSSSGRPRSEDYKYQFTAEVGFHCQEQSEDKVIELKDFMASIGQREELVADDEVGFIAIVASAGSGKTTLTKRIAQQALSCVTANENVSLSKHEMVHYVELRYIKEENSIKPSKFLFGGLYKSESEEDLAFEWLINNQTKAILIFDGLDQASWNFDKNTLQKMKKYDKRNTSTIMYNILARNILRHVKILVASRELKVSELPALARPKKIIKLNGLALEDARKLFLVLLGENGNELWKTIETMSPRLLQLVTVPVFLILTAIVMGRDPNRPPPTTVTDLYNRIVLNLQSIENIRNREEILTIIKKLKAMAFQGMKEKRVIFQGTDLTHFGLTANKVQDLLTKVPGNNLLSRHLMEGDFKFFFCHQSMQEFLAASFVGEMEFNEFTNFNEQHLHDSHWSVVRRFVGGIVFSKLINGLHEVSNQARKQKVLSQSLLSQLETKNDSFTRMELYTVIYESDDSEMASYLSVIDVSGIALSLDQAHVVGSLIARRPLLEYLNLGNCLINDQNLQVIAEYLKDRVQVLKLTTTSNHDVELWNEGDIINISGKGISGHFRKREAMLEFEWFFNIDRFSITMFFKTFLEPESIKINVSYDDLQSMPEKGMFYKVDNLLFHSFQDRNIDWSLIKDYVRKYQVKLLDIEVESKTSTEEYCNIFGHGDEMSSFVIDANIHSIFFIRNADDIQSILQACHQNQIKSMRCMIDWLYSPSPEDIISLTKKCERLTLMYWRENEMLDEEELEKVKEISSIQDTEFRVSCGDERDAWWEIALQYQTGSVTLNEDQHVSHELSNSVVAASQNQWRTITQEEPTKTQQVVHKTLIPNLEQKDVHLSSFTQKGPDGLVAGNQIKQNSYGSASHQSEVSATLDEDQRINLELSSSVLNVGQNQLETIAQNVHEKFQDSVCETRSQSLQHKGGEYAHHPSKSAKCSFISSAGDHIMVSGHQNKEIKNKDLIKIVNDNTQMMASVDILDDFRQEKLHQPDLELYPQMVEIDSEDYYKCRYGLRNQLRQEAGQQIKDKVLKIDDIIASVWRKRELARDEKITAIIGSAGSGKSTLARRIAQKALSILNTNNESMCNSQQQQQRMVRYIELKDMEGGMHSRPSKFLFGGLYPIECDEDQAFEWLDAHQMKAILIFDGLDQATWNVDKNPRKIKKFEVASPSTIMYNILSGNILRAVKIFIASRECGISELPALARPGRIIALNGFAFEDARRLFISLLGEKGEGLWEKIEMMSSHINRLISVPVFLFLVAVVMGRDPVGPPPTTVTELYNRILPALLSVENIRNREGILSIIYKLKAIAFQGMKEGRVVFKVTDLKEFRLSAEEVQDLMSKVPGNSLLSTHLMEGDFNFSFCHQNIQEFLAASFIAEMKLKKFSQFDGEHLHDNCWSVVRRFVAGIVFSKQTNYRHRVSDQTKKQQILSRSILSKLKNTNDISTRMELYTVMCESDNDYLMKQVSAINVSDMDLRRHEVHTIGTLITRCDGLESLDMIYRDISDDIVTTMTICRDSPIQDDHTNLDENTFSLKALSSFAGLRRNESQHLDWKVIRFKQALQKTTSSTRLFMSRYITLSKKGHIIKIHDGRKQFKGRFHIKESKFAYDRVYWLARLLSFLKIFEPEVVQTPTQLLYVTQNDLRQVSRTNIEKMSEILLDCTQEENIDWSCIRDSVKKYQVAFLNIAVDGKISTEEYEDILRHKNEISGLSVHLVFYMSNERDIQSVLDTCQAKKVGSVRCEIEFCALLGDIKRLVKASKKLTLVYGCEKHMLNEAALTEVKSTERRLGAQLEISCSQKCDRDAWWVLDSKLR